MKRSHDETTATTKMKMGMPVELHALFERLLAVARLLPSKDEMEEALEDPHARAEAQLILKEMRKIEREIDDFVAAARKARLSKS